MMSFILSWRRVAVACALLAVAASVVAVRALPGADAQQPQTETFVVSELSIAPNNGFTTFPFFGFNQGIDGVACTGASPLGGTARIPGQVVTQRRANDTQLRVVQTNGQAVTGQVTINCAITMQITPEAEAALEQLKSATGAD
jgi:hypothetical protein